MKKTFLFSLLISLALSCSKKDEDVSALATPVPPKMSVFDVNNDTVDDFAIEYSHGIWDGFETSGDFFSGKVEPLGENTILQEYEENVSSTLLFAHTGDSILRQTDDTLSWTNQGWFISLFQGGDGVWPKEWRIESPKTSAPYYIGMQIQEEDIFLLGWLKLEIDTTTGEVKILDSAFTTEDSILIDR